MFRSCSWETAATLSGLYYTGISAAEIRAALLLHRIPHAEWPRITRGIQRVMVPAAQQNLNPKKG